MLVKVARMQKVAHKLPNTIGTRLRVYLGRGQQRTLLNKHAKIVFNYIFTMRGMSGSNRI